jgi:hypothetical protein
VVSVSSVGVGRGLTSVEVTEARAVEQNTNRSEAQVKQNGDVDGAGSPPLSQKRRPVTTLFLGYALYSIKSYFWPIQCKFFCFI